MDERQQGLVEQKNQNEKDLSTKPGNGLFNIYKNVKITTKVLDIFVNIKQSISRFCR